MSQVRSQCRFDNRLKILCKTGLPGVARSLLSLMKCIPAGTGSVPVYHHTESQRSAIQQPALSSSEMMDPEKIMPLRYKTEQIELHKKALIDILDTLPSIIVRVDRDGVIDLVNRRFELYSGVSAGNAMGMQIASLVPQFSDQLRLVSQVVDNQSPIEFEKIPCRNGAQQSYYSVDIYPLKSEGAGMAVIRIDDITEHVRIEDIMAHTEKMTMVGGLAAGMAHEINNPLGAIMQNAQNIERRVSLEIAANLRAADELGVSLDLVRAYLDKRGIFDFISHIRTAGVRASNIINNMLQFSRRSEPQVEIVNISGMLDRTLELAASDYDMKKVYGFRNVELVREYAPDMPPVCMTVPEMEQVFLNIIKNAAQALHDSEKECPPRITLRTRTDAGMAVIEIEDNGPGIDEGICPRIFEPFFSTKDVGVGTGLGLSVAYAIVTKGHNGTLKVSSNSGEGTCFTIELPMRGKC